MVCRARDVDCSWEVSPAGIKSLLVELVSTQECRRQDQGLSSYLDVEKRTRGEESLKAAAVEASRLIVVVEKRIVYEVATEKVNLAKVALPVALWYSDNSQEPR